MSNGGTPAPPDPDKAPDLDAVLRLNGANVIRGELHTVAEALRGLGDTALDAYAKFVTDTSEGKRGGKGPPPPEARDGMDYDLWLIEAVKIGRAAILNADRRAAARQEIRR